MNYKLNIRQVSYALSEALDMVGIDDLYHGKRVAFMASELCKNLKFSQKKIDDIINIGMLHDCGVSNTDIHMNLIKELDWIGSQNHCKRGYELLKGVHFYNNYASVVLYHHTHWSHLMELDLDDEIKLNANIILLSDRVDALRAQSKTHDEIIEILISQKNKMFKAELVDIFIEISNPSSFWLYLESENLEVFLYEWISQAQVEDYEYSSLKEVAFMFASIVDAKSPYTAEHSINVAAVSLYLGEKFNLSEKELEILELASLLHDLGKLRVDDSILDKKGSLNAQERLIMNRHGFDSEMILRKINGFQDVAYLASSHHETLDGKGYPYQKNADSLSMSSRILMLSDVFQALVQNRPYRQQLSVSDILSILNEMKDAGKIDTNIFSVIEDNIDTIYSIADSNTEYKT